MEHFLLQAGVRSAGDVLLYAVAMAAALLIFIFFSLRREKNRFDSQLFEWVKRHTNENNNRLMLFFTSLGNHKFFIPVNLILLVYFIFIKNQEYALKIPVIALSSVALMFLLKRIFYRMRPENPLLKKVRGLSYPSGHALMSVSFYGLLIHIIWHNIPDPGLKWVLILLLILLIQIIGFSRVYLRVHYASDVLAGYALGLLWLLLCIYAWPET